MNKKQKEETKVKLSSASATVLCMSPPADRVDDDSTRMCISLHRTQGVWVTCSQN